MRIMRDPVQQPHFARVADFQPVYYADGRLDLFLFQLERPGRDGRLVRLTQAVKFLQVTELKKHYRDLRSFLEHQDDVVSTMYDPGHGRGRMYGLYSLSNILGPTRHGLLQMYGVRGFGHNPDEAVQRARRDAAALRNVLFGKYRQIVVQDLPGDLALDYYAHLERCQNLGVVLGQPIPKHTAGLGNMGDNPLQATEDQQEEMEVMAVACADVPFQLMCWINPMSFDQVNELLVRTAEEERTWASRVRETTNVSGTIMIPLMFANFFSAMSDKMHVVGATDQASYQHNLTSAQLTGREALLHIQDGQVHQADHATFVQSQDAAIHTVEARTEAGHETVHDHVASTEHLEQDSALGWSTKTQSTLHERGTVTLAQTDQVQHQDQLHTQGVEDQTLTASEHVQDTYGQTEHYRDDYQRGETGQRSEHGSFHEAGSFTQSGVSSQASQVTTAEQWSGGQRVEARDTGTAQNWGDAARNDQQTYQGGEATTGHQAGSSFENVQGSGGREVTGAEASRGVEARDTVRGGGQIDLGIVAGRTVEGSQVGRAVDTASDQHYSLGEARAADTTLDTQGQTTVAGNRDTQVASQYDNVDQHVAVGQRTEAGAGQRATVTTVAQGGSYSQAGSFSRGGSFSRNFGYSEQAAGWQEGDVAKSGVRTDDVVRENVQHVDRATETTYDGQRSQVLDQVQQFERVTAASRVEKGSTVSHLTQLTVRDLDQLRETDFARQTDLASAAQVRTAVSGQGDATLDRSVQTVTADQTLAVREQDGPVQNQVIARAVGAAETDAVTIRQGVTQSGLGYAMLAAGSSRQIYNADVDLVAQLLEMQRRRLQGALDTGLFLAHTYLGAYNSTDLHTVARAIVAALREENTVVPLRVETTPADDADLRDHLIALEPCSRLDALGPWYVESHGEYLTANDLAALTHPLRTDGHGGINTTIEAIPTTAAVIHGLRGPVCLGEQIAPATGRDSSEDYRLPMSQLQHLLCIGRTGSGKSNTVMLAVRDAMNQARQRVQGRSVPEAGITIFDPKGSWRRVLALLDHPDEAHLYTLHSPHWRTFFFNPLRIPSPYITPDTWASAVAQRWAIANATGNLGARVLKTAIMDLYRAQGVYDPATGTAHWEASRHLRMPHLYDRLKDMLDDMTGGKGKRGGGDITVGVLRRILEKMQPFTPEEGGDVYHVFSVQEGVTIEQIMAERQLTIIEGGGTVTADDAIKMFVYSLLTAACFYHALGRF
ncbi:MAG: hypothetical protein KKA73_11905, partial [Chloroflexi bacterium]|nr:hypothetical protein [Chloroflexota bacterium]